MKSSKKIKKVKNMKWLLKFIILFWSFSSLNRHSRWWKQLLSAQSCAVEYEADLYEKVAQQLFQVLRIAQKADMGRKGGFSAGEVAFQLKRYLFSIHTISYNFNPARVPGIKHGLWPCIYALSSSRFYFQQQHSIFITVLYWRWPSCPFMALNIVQHAKLRMYITVLRASVAMLKY